MPDDFDVYHGVVHIALIITIWSNKQIFCLLFLWLCILSCVLECSVLLWSIMSFLSSWDCLLIFAFNGWLFQYTQTLSAHHFSCHVSGTPSSLLVHFWLMTSTSYLYLCLVFWLCYLRIVFMQAYLFHFSL